MNSKYSCEKCGKIFKQKSRYDLHMKKKKPCVAEGVEEKKDEVFEEEKIEEMKTYKDLFNFLKGYDCDDIYQWIEEPWVGKDKQECLLRLFSCLGLVEKLNKYKVCKGNFNMKTIEKIENIKDYFYVGSSVRKLKDKGDSSDLTGIHKDDDKHLLVTTSKNMNNLNVGFLDVDKILTNFRQYEVDGYVMTLCICIRNVDEYIRMKDNIERTNGELRTIIERDDTIVVDWEDLNYSYKIFKENFGCLNFDEVVESQKDIIVLKMHQKLSVMKTMRMKEGGKRRILWGHIQRSGKSYIIAGTIIEDCKNKDVCNYLVITTAPNETISQQVGVFDCVQMENFNVVVLNGKNKKPLLGDRNIIICSKQFLQCKIDEKEEKTNSIPWLKKINFDMRFVDESHNGGTTELAKKTLDFYGKDVFTVQITATYSKPVNDFGILKEDWILWDMEDIKLCKNIDKEGKIKRLVEKHGVEFRNIIDKYSTSSIIEEYSRYPELNILSDELNDNVVSEIISSTKNNDYGWSTDACFLLKQGVEGDKIVLKKEFQNEAETLKLWYRIFGKRDRFGIPDDEFPDEIVFIKRIEMICKNSIVDSRFIGDNNEPSIIMAFLPQNNINKISEATITLLEKYDVIPEYEIVSINSKVTNDPKQMIEEARIRAKNGGKKAVLVLSGRQCSLGVSIKNCDIVLMLNNTMSFDLIYQMMFRCMTEEVGKRCGFVVDPNIHRVVNMSITDYALLIKPEIHPKEAIKYILQERIINLNSDHWMACFANRKDKIDILSQNIYEVYSSNFENLSSILDKFKTFEILLSRDDQKIFNTLFSGKTMTKKDKEKMKELMSDEENINKGIKKVGCDLSSEDGSECFTEDNEKYNDDAKVNYMDVFKHIIPLVCILSIRSEESSFIEMFKIIKDDRYVYNIFLQQTKSWWGENVNSDVMKKIRNIYKRSFSNNDGLSQLIRVVKELFVKNIGNSKGLSEAIDKYLIPHELEKKTNAEISTPYKLRQEMLDKVPIEFWSTPKKVFEPCSGKGGFVIDIVHRFMEGMKEIIVDEKERYRVTVEECLYFSDINPTNIFICKLLLDPYDEYNLNYNEGDTLELDVRDKWDIGGFDAVVGNPPYNNELWSKFVSKSLDVLRSDGYLLYVHPANWRKPEHKIGKIMLSYDILELCIYDIKTTSKIFNCNVRVDWYLLRKSRTDIDTNIIDEKNNVLQLDIKNAKFIPNFDISLITNISKMNLTKLNIVRSHTIISNDKKLKEHREGKHIYQVLTNLNSKEKRIKYSDKYHQEHFSNKVLMSYSLNLYPYYDDGNISPTEHVFYQKVENEIIGNKLVSYIDSNFFKNIMNACKWIGYQTDHKIFKYIPDLSLYYDVFDRINFDINGQSGKV